MQIKLQSKSAVAKPSEFIIDKRVKTIPCFTALHANAQQNNFKRTSTIITWII